MLSSKELLAAGIKPSEVFGRCLQCNTIEQALALWEESQSHKVKKNSVRMISGSVWEWLCLHPCLKGMFSVENREKIASNSEKRRWIEQGAMLLNGRSDWNPDEQMVNPVSLVFFPNGKHKCTIL